MDHHAYRDGAKDDVTHREQPDGAHVRAEIQQRGPQRGGIQERRQQAYQYQLGVQLKGRNERQEGTRNAGEDQEQRNGNVDFPAQRTACAHHRHQHDQAQSDFHAAILSAQCAGAGCCCHREMPDGGRSPTAGRGALGAGLISRFSHR